MTLDEAIEHTKSVVAECEGSDSEGKRECAEEHARLAGWLTELRCGRKAITELREELRELHRNVACSQDGNVHVKVEISQLSKRWCCAAELSELSYDYCRVPKHDQLMMVGEPVLKEVIIGFLKDLEA